MSWGIFVYTVVPSGAFLLAMLASGKAAPMWVASKVMSTPVTCGNLQYSAGAVMTAFCTALSYLSYLSLRRAEYRSEQSDGQDSVRVGEQMRDVFHQGRNLYLSMLGLALWATAWRLKVLYDHRQLHTFQIHVHRRPLVVRIFFMMMGFGALLLADIPLCRVNYNLQLATFVTPKKNALLKSTGHCEGIMMASAGGQCGEFCEEVRKLSQERYNAIQFARNWHVLGRWAAEFFDDSRGVKQGASRIEALFEKKSCREVLQSVDKSNQMVNYLCITFAGVSLIGAFTFFAAMFHERSCNDPDHVHGD